MIDTGKPKRPVLRYFGGKYRLAPWIIKHLPGHRTYVEPFCGAASVLMRKPRAYSEAINDLDQDIVNLFEVLRDPNRASRLERMLRFTPFSREEFELAYEPAHDPVEQARHLVVRSFMGHSGVGTFGHSTGFRCDTKRSGTTPAHGWTRYPDALDEMTDRLRGVVIENRPAREVIRRHEGPNTLFYVDPPYVSDTRGKSDEIYRHEMSREEHCDLADTLLDVEGMVVLSGYPSELYATRYEAQGWSRICRTARADNASKRTECLWLNAPAQANQRQHNLFS